jgi:hypothetical protein
MVLTTGYTSVPIASFSQVNLGIDVVLFENFDETVAQAALVFRAGSYC